METVNIPKILAEKIIEEFYLCKTSYGEFCEYDGAQEKLESMISETLLNMMRQSWKQEYRRDT